ncbi:MAG: GDSL-type esterase/lipase family protein [Methanospirillum sp.]
MSTFHASQGPPRSGAGLLLAALVLVVALCGAASAAVQILPLGDSITHGGVGGDGVLHPSYRAPLYQGLQAEGYDVDFVGSEHVPALPDGLDPDNEGHPGYTAGQILAGLPGWLGSYPPPQIALVHLGTNDVAQSVSNDRTIADLTSIIGTLRARNPSMTILVAQIIPTSTWSINNSIVTLNQRIAGLASLSTAQSPVVIVDQWSGYDGIADNQADGVHPLASGEAKMAARWEAALTPYLDRSPTDTVPPGPVTNLHVTARTASSITWAWTDPTDADFARVEVSRDGTYRASVAPGVQTYTLAGLKPGTPYTLGARTYDQAGNGAAAIASTAQTLTADTVPPRSVTNLREVARTSSSITWAWTDPTDADFAQVRVYQNGVYKASVPKGVRRYTLTGLSPNTAYTLGTRTVDAAGNVNPTQVRDSARTRR